MSRLVGYAVLPLVIAVSALMALAIESDQPSELKPPVVKCTGVSPGEGFISATFDVTNPNDMPLPYVGYTSDSFEGGLKEGTISPIYRIEVKQRDQWNKHGVGFCGTGIGPVTLPSKKSVTFAVALPAAEWDAAKVGLTWWPPGADSENAVVAWSQDISRPQPSAAK
jgi:hypothetical protein